MSKSSVIMFVMVIVVLLVQNHYNKKEIKLLEDVAIELINRLDSTEEANLRLKLENLKLEYETTKSN